jgi:hypothetical protein
VGYVPAHHWPPAQLRKHLLEGPEKHCIHAAWVGNGPAWKIFERISARQAWRVHPEEYEPVYLLLVLALATVLTASSWCQLRHGTRVWPSSAGHHVGSAVLAAPAAASRVQCWWESLCWGLRGLRRLSHQQYGEGDSGPCMLCVLTGLRRECWFRLFRKMMTACTPPAPARWRAGPTRRARTAMASAVAASVSKPSLAPAMEPGRSEDRPMLASTGALAAMNVHTSLHLVVLVDHVSL